MTANPEAWFKLFACCIIVEGVSSSLIYDVQRNKFYDLPNDYLDILYSSKINDITTIKKNFGYSSEAIDIFFNNFIKEEIGFYTKSPNSFPEINLTWDSPYHITNSIIELDFEKSFNFASVIRQLDSLACYAIQIRLLSIFTIDFINELVAYFKNSRFMHIEILILYESIKLESLIDLIKNEARLYRIMIYAGLEDKILLSEPISNKSIIQFRKDIRLDQEEIINIGRFTTNVEMFSEAQEHNLGLNRKVCIDKNGEIKSYLSHDFSYGNVNNVPIIDIIKKNEFREKWTIKNDNIEICMDCKYRYACISNSDIIEREDKIYKTNYCNYDPYSDNFN